jgi:hypothetical protein
VTTRNDLKQLAEKIELLAKEVQSKADSGGDLMNAANELARNNLTFVFTLGEVYANENGVAGKKVKAKTVSNPNRTPRSYKRDALGRFSRV